MKKLFSVVLAGVVLSALTASVAASDIGESKGAVPKIDSGVIKVDGEMDDAYAQALKVDINQFFIGTETGTYGEAYMLWADGSYYLYVRVYDNDVQIPGEDVQMSTPWCTDSVEMFFDFGNEHEDLVQQFRVDYSGFPSYYSEGGADSAYGPEAAAPYFDEYAATWTNYGYNIEMRVNLEKYGLKEGDAIGLQLQINDMTAADTVNTTAVYNMASSLNAGSWEVDNYDYITLGSRIEVEVPADPAEETPTEPAEGDTAPVETTTAPTTADAGIVAAAAVMAAAAGIVLSKKR